MKIHISFRVSSEAVRLIKVLSDEKGISQASIVEIAIRDLAKREKIEIQKTK
jgi:hypothetical protein